MLWFCIDCSNRTFPSTSRHKIATTGQSTEQPTAPSTSFCLRETRMLWRRRLPPLDPFQWQLMLPDPDLPSTGVVGYTTNTFPVCFSFNFMFLSHFYHFCDCRSLRWFFLLPRREPRRVGCWLRHTKRTRLLAGQEQVRHVGFSLYDQDCTTSSVRVLTWSTLALVE